MLCALAGLLAGCQGHSGEPLVLASGILLYEDQPRRTELGALRFEAGFVLASADAAFGGLSGLWIAPDGRELVAVSDRGTLWRADLDHDGDRLVALSGWQATRLGPPPGQSRARLDAEALAPAADGDLVVAFEGAVPLARLARGDPGAPLRPHAAAGALREAAAAGNRGIEALTGLPDGDLLALAEGVRDGQGRLAAWRIGEDGTRRLHYATSEGFVPVGADRLDQAIYVVERRFALSEGGFASRLMVFDADQVIPGATIQGRELARLAWPALSENFEGIAVRRGADGGALLYLISDDNFLPIQRTLLLQFSLAPQIR